MDKLTSWWQDLETREQLVVSVGGLVFGLVVFFFLGVMPVMDWRAQTQMRLEQARDEANEVRQLAARVKANQANTGNATNDNKGLSVLIDDSLRENELTMRGFQPGRNNDARLRLENAAYPSLAQWLYDLEYRHKVTIIDLSLTPASASGRLMVSMRVSK